MKKFTIALLLCLTTCAASAATLTIPMHLVSNNQPIGDVRATMTSYGLLLIPSLHHLPPGTHGFHIHQNPSCADQAMAAGGHWDPKHTNKHLGPYNKDGHFGDLPVLFVSVGSTATLPVLAPRIKSLKQIKHHALIIHIGSDNYSDYPKKLGGGGKRIACGVIR